jgi:hypothetical protein
MIKNTTQFGSKKKSKIVSYIISLMFPDKFFKILPLA